MSAASSSSRVQPQAQPGPASSEDLAIFAACTGIEILSRGFDISDLRSIGFGALKYFILAKIIIFVFSEFFDWRRNKILKAFIDQPFAEVTGLRFVKGDPVPVRPVPKDDNDKGGDKVKRVVVCEFWATWCKPCEATAPHLSEVAKKFADKEVHIIGITNEANAVGKVEAFVRKMGDKMAYAVAIDTDGSAHRNLLDRSGSIGIPHAVVLSTEGTPVWSGHPMDPEFEVVVAREAERASPRRAAR
ncbi:thioredoxin-like protein [Zopfochytrium polystomum]|nr:thioredoxin-like protein [Zopfochytrium polystomum]